MEDDDARRVAHGSPQGIDGSLFKTGADSYDDDRASEISDDDKKLFTAVLAAPFLLQVAAFVGAALDNGPVDGGAGMGTSMDYF